LGYLGKTQITKNAKYSSKGFLLAKRVYTKSFRTQIASSVDNEEEACDVYFTPPQIELFQTSETVA